MKSEKKRGKNSSRNLKKKGFFSQIKERFHLVISNDGEMNKPSFSIMEVVIIILISILFGILVGYVITCTRGVSNSTKSSSKVTEIVNTYNSIVDNYYDDIDKNKLADAAIKGMIESLDDPYSNYMDSETTSSFNESVEGSFVGIGVVVTYDENLKYNTIIDVIKGTPAEKYGLKVDDVIVKVDGEDVKEAYGDNLAKLIRGKQGTKVKLTIKRGNKEKEITLKRGIVEIESVTSKTLEYNDKKIGYLKIDSFATNTYEQFYKALKRLEKKNIDSLVLDVRDNPGGHLLQTRQILSLFFPKKTVLYQIQSKNVKKKIYSDSSETRKYPVAILVNNGTASAAEILATCFHDNYKDSIIVGNPTYGKGTVQKAQSLSSGNSIKYTTQKWLTSKGKWLNQKGLQPDIVVDQSEEYFENPEYNTDVQLQEALKNLK